MNIDPHFISNFLSKFEKKDIPFSKQLYFTSIIILKHLFNFSHFI